MKVWILVEASSIFFGDEVRSRVGAYATKELALSMMNYKIRELIDFYEDNGYPELIIDWQDETGAGLVSGTSDDRWIYKIEEVEVISSI